MPCRVPKRRFSCGAPQHLTKNLFKSGLADYIGGKIIGFLGKLKKA